jgi:monoamine oxidase
MVETYDAIVVGGGFAGLVAARDLADAGHTVVLLEARERLGGRTWTTTYPGSDFEVEMGGHYVSRAKQHQLAAELDRYDVATAKCPVPETFPTILNDTYRPGPMPIPEGQIVELERAILHCQTAAARIVPGIPLDQQGLTDLDVSFAEFLAPLGLPAEAFEFVAAVAGMYLFRHPEEMSALHALNVLSCYELSGYAMWGSTDERFAHGSKQLADRIAADIPEIRLSAVVAQVDQTGADVEVTLASGELLRARAVVVATPLNTWNDIEFLPPLAAVKREAAAEEHGLTVADKAWVRVREAPHLPFVVAAPRSAEGAALISTERVFADGDQLMAVFAYASAPGDDYEMDFNDPEHIARAVATLLPGAQVVSWHTHDFAADPFSKGAWVAYKPGRLSRSHSRLQAPEGRVSFATSDIATRWLLWIEGAVESGHDAARDVNARLTSEEDAVATTVG